MRVALHLWQRSVSISPLVNSFLWTTAHSCFWSVICLPFPLLLFVFVKLNLGVFAHNFSFLS